MSRHVCRERPTEAELANALASFTAWREPKLGDGQPEKKPRELR